MGEACLAEESAGRVCPRARRRRAAGGPSWGSGGLVVALARVGEEHADGEAGEQGRDAALVLDELVALRAADALDETFEAEPAQVGACLAWAVAAPEELGQLGAEALVCEGPPRGVEGAE